MVSDLVYYQKYFFIGRICRWILLLLGCDIPKTVQVPRKLYLAHHGNGVCIHKNTIIEKGVRIFQQVTIGRSDVYLPAEKSDMERVIIKEYAILGAGCKILCGHNTLTIGKDAIIAANAVVTKDVPDGEVWGGVPAKCLYRRNPDNIFHGPAR